MSDDKDEKNVESTPEPTPKKKKPEAKPEDKQASWSDHKQAELGDIPEKVEEWFKTTKLGQAYDGMYSDMKEKSKAGVVDAVQSIGNAVNTLKEHMFGTKGDKPEDGDSLTPMTNAKQASSPIAEENLNALDKLGQNAAQPEKNQPEPSAKSTDIKNPS